MTAAPACFALLDDAGSAGTSRLYTGLHSTLRGDAASELDAALTQMQQALQAGLHALTLFAYELGPALHGVPTAAQRNASVPLFEILLFTRCQLLSADQVTHWLQDQASDAPAGLANIEANVNETEFSQQLARIHAWIEAGDTYQVNYTWRLHFDAFGAPADLYCRLRQRQPVPYGALIALPDGRAILSFSPELFVRHQDGVLTAQPMKGTAAASGDASIDAQRAQALAQDGKNRAENLMIVDLLRNDLGQLAQTGSVTVPALFDVQRFGAVLQMTSTVTARLRPELTLQQIVAALYPCGSITGAPKRRTMEIIAELEPAARGIYTGAIGWFDAPKAIPKSLQSPPGRGASAGDALLAHSGIGNFCLSVPIRTLHLQPPGQNGLRRGEMGVGSGIVHDSVAHDEFQECRLKAGFLTGLAQPFELFETMYATRETGCRNVAAHWQRLGASAKVFGFGCDLPALQAQLAAAVQSLPQPQQAYRLKLSLAWLGQARIEFAPLSPLPAVVGLRLARRHTQDSDLFLLHKTSVRAEYDAGWREAEQHGCFDTLFVNSHGTLCEGGRSSVFLQLDGQWFTPPLVRGVLPGIMRAQLLCDPAWAAQERELTLDDLRRAQQIVVCNALRGVMPAKVADDGWFDV